MFYHVLRCCKHIQWLEEIKCFKMKNVFLLYVSASATDIKTVFHKQTNIDLKFDLQYSPKRTKGQINHTTTADMWD